MGILSAFLKDYRDARTRPWVLAFLASTALRFLAVIPFVIDDDEAWWVAAARVLKTPWEYYFRAVDHKTPGIVWFYWFLDRIVPSHCDPQVTRGLYTAFFAVAALLLGRLANRLRGPEGDSRGLGRIGWMTASLFLVGSLAACPKLMSITADGLMTLFVIAGYALAFGFEFPGRSIVAGAVLGCGVMVKQTGVFFALPILFCRRPKSFSWKEITGFAAGSLLLIAPMIWAMDFQEFLYWNWTYPREVLLSVRSKLFDGNFQLLLSVVMIGLALFPVFVWAFAFVRRRERSFFWKDARALWLVAGFLVMMAGKGLFLHYFIGLMPPLAMLAAEGLDSTESGKTPKAWHGWLAAGYLYSCLLMFVTPIGAIWGTDLPYFERVGKVLKDNVPHDQKILVWGGSALPLTYSGLDYVTAYVTPRFGIEPYASRRSHAAFLRELAANMPAAIVDLTERSDNGLNNPITSEPEVAERIARSYRPYRVPGIPWAKFYLSFAPPAGTELQEIRPSGEAVATAYQPFPAESESWRRLLAPPLFDSLKRLGSAQRNLRARQSLELIGNQSADPAARDQARRYLEELSLAETAEPAAEAVRFVESYHALPWQSPVWWVELIFVELQPRSYHGTAKPGDILTLRGMPSTSSRGSSYATRLH